MARDERCICEVGGEAQWSDEGKISDEMTGSNVFVYGGES